MKALFTNANVYAEGKFKKQTVLLDGASFSIFTGDVSAVAPSVPVFDNMYILPGLCDVHVHFREPGFSYKETIGSGSLAAAAGGYTACMPMPNLSPCPDSVENLSIEEKIIEKDSVIPLFPYATITKGQKGEELTDIEGLPVIALSDDGRGVQSEEMMREAMIRAARSGKVIAAHCEDNSLLFGGYIHDGEYAKAHGHRGICSESEYRQIERDLKLAEQTGVSYHVCHISTKESVELIRKAKAKGVDVTAETGPHYLILDDSDLLEDGRFKMNPPLRSREDKLALIEGIKDGTVDMIATDHAPHSAEEKSRGLEKSLMGIVGIETAFPLMYTEFVRTGILSLSELVDLMSKNPRIRFGIDSDVGYTVYDLSAEYEIDPGAFLSMGRATPFTGRRVFGKCLMTAVNGKAVYISKELKGL